VKRRVRRSGAHLICLALLAIAGCVTHTPPRDVRFTGDPERGAGPGVLVRWTLDLAPPFTGAYVPVEQATPGVDAVNDRVYTGSTRGKLIALNLSGHPVYSVDAGAGIEAQPVSDPARGEVYVSTVRGGVLALRGADGSQRWKAEVGASISQPGLLSSDALYVVTDEDSVIAFSRSDGSVLWRYRREPHEGFVIAGHAGLTNAGGKLLTGFGDGTVVALDASDGRVIWETDTSVDLVDVESTQRFVDVDTTPAVAGDLVYIASFTGGLYALELATGTVHAHEGDLHGVTGVTATTDALILSSAEAGVVCLELPQLSVRWRHRVDRGAPGKTQVQGDNVYFAESLGALLALSLADGREMGRLESAHGFTAPPSFEGRVGFALSNAAKLFSFSY
jgi:outer membrane protein assembly factor BamB